MTGPREPNLAGVLRTAQACMVLRLEAEEVTQYGDDLDAECKRELLSALLASLDAVLAFLRKAGRPSHITCRIVLSFRTINHHIAWIERVIV
jgi:hypothetical protein